MDFTGNALASLLKCIQTVCVEGSKHADRLQILCRCPDGLDSENDRSSCMLSGWTEVCKGDYLRKCVVAA